MLKKKFLTILMMLVCLINVLIIPAYAIEIPEKDINLKIENLTRGCTVYALIPESLLQYNMDRFVSNNINNSYEVERIKAEKIREFSNNKDYEGYVKYFLELGFTCGAHEIELRHYCFCFGLSEEYEFEEFDGQRYLKIKLNLADNNTFKIIMKDYLVNRDTDGIKFLIDEYGSYTFVTLDNIPATRSRETPHITEYNILHEYVSKEDFESIERTIDLTYLIIYIILTLVLIYIISYAMRKWLDQKEEKKMRLFWKKEVKEKLAQIEAEESMDKKEKKAYRKELKKEKAEKKKELKKAIKLSRMNRKKNKKKK